MSAFLCSDDHFRALAIYAVGSTGTGYGQGRRRVAPNRFPWLSEAERCAQVTVLAGIYADILRRENERSMESRYAERFHASNNPVRIRQADFADPRYELDPVSILKMCDCLEYQSCETADYRQSNAFELLDAIRGAAIHELPGYDDAPWAFDLPSTAKAEAPPSWRG